jgi:hypothetical protein
MLKYNIVNRIGTEYETVGGMKIGRESRSTYENPP